MGQTQCIATKNLYVRQAAANTRQRQKLWRFPSIVRKRGCSVCVHCSCSNGNRAFTCKECKNPLPGKTIKRPKRLSSTDVSDLRTNSQETPSGTKIFSTKVRRDGPDYRTLVVYAEGKWKCFYKDCIVAQDARGRSASTLELDASAVACKGPQAYVEVQTPARELWRSSSAREERRESLESATRAIKRGAWLGSSSQRAELTFIGEGLLMRCTKSDMQES